MTWLVVSKLANMQRVRVIANFIKKTIWAADRNAFNLLSFFGRGYLAPEYAVYGQISEKLDVYSFGVVLLEVVSGRRNLDNTMSEDHISLLKLVRYSHSQTKSLLSYSITP